MSILLWKLQIISKIRKHRLEKYFFTLRIGCILTIDYSALTVPLVVQHLQWSQAVYLRLWKGNILYEKILKGYNMGRRMIRGISGRVWQNIKCSQVSAANEWTFDILPHEVWYSTDHPSTHFITHLSHYILIKSHFTTLEKATMFKSYRTCMTHIEVKCWFLEKHVL